MLSNTEPLRYPSRCLKTDFCIKAQFHKIIVYLNGLNSHICSMSVKPEKNLLAVLNRPEFSIFLPHYIPRGIGGQNLQRPWPQ